MQQAPPNTPDFDSLGYERVVSEAYDAGSGGDKSTPLYTDAQGFIIQELVSTTNVATNTYYPSTSGIPNDGTKDVTITGTLIDGAAETTTLTVEVSNLGGVTATDWMQIKIYDNMNGVVVDSFSATNATVYFAASMDNIGSFAYRRYRIQTTAATNTVKIEEKAKAL
jgi:hypothetical protein